MKEKNLLVCHYEANQMLAAANHFLIKEILKNPLYYQRIF